MTVKTKNRPHIVTTTLTDSELAALRVQANDEGMTQTAYLRRLIIKNCLEQFSAEFRQPKSESS